MLRQNKRALHAPAKVSGGDLVLTYALSETVN